MKKRVFEGVATALITPMNDDTTVNYKRLESLVDEQIKGGVDALVICGTTGEKSTLRYDEHLKVIEVSVKAAKKRVPIIAGTGSNDTVYSVELCNDAEKVGADAFLMVTPYYNKTSQNGLIAHYNYIADRVNKPIILYNVPSQYFSRRSSASGSASHSCFCWTTSSLICIALPTRQRDRRTIWRESR